MHLWPVETRSFHRGSTTRNNQNAGVSLRECLLHEWTILWPDEAEISRSWAPRNSERVQFFSVNRPDFHRNRSTSTDLSKKAWEIRRLKLLAPSFGPRVAIFCFSARTLAASSRACLTCHHPNFDIFDFIQSWLPFFSQESGSRTLECTN